MLLAYWHLVALMTVSIEFLKRQKVAYYFRFFLLILKQIPLCV